MTPVLQWSGTGAGRWVWLALLGCSQALAHHGTRISYDWTNPTRMSGTVSEFVWRNPHAQLFFDVTDEAGNVVRWGAEMNSPVVLSRSGWTRTTLEPGDVLEATIYPSRAGTTVGEVSRTHPIIVNGAELSHAPAAAGLVEPTGPPPEGPYAARDLSGLWASTEGPRRSVTGEAPAPMTPQGRAKYDAQLPSYGPRAIPPALGNDPAAECNPVGLTRLLLSFRPFEFIHTAERVVQIFEVERTWREIWVDGRELPVDADPRWLGYSVGRWEGDTFVVETASFDDRTWLDSYANPHSDGMRLVERWRRTGPGTLALEMVIHDPVMYTEPVVVETKVFARLTGREIQEVICAPADEGAFNERIRDPAGGIVE